MNNSKRNSERSEMPNMEKFGEMLEVVAAMWRQAEKADGDHYEVMNANAVFDDDNTFALMSLSRMIQRRIIWKLIHDDMVKIVPDVGSADFRFMYDGNSPSISEIELYDQQGVLMHVSDHVMDQLIDASIEWHPVLLDAMTVTEWHRNSVARAVF